MGPLFLAAAAQVAGTPPAEDRFEVVELARALDRPLELAVAPDGRVFFIELAGSLKVWRPATRDVLEAGELAVFADQENGLLGLALDPGFAANRWLYLLYSPADFSGQRLARFTVVDDRLDRASERVLLAFEEQRVECCHHAGSLAFGPEGCLFVATGDNVNPAGDTEGFAPIDEREGRMPWDARRSSANTKNLGGKILRIRPTPDGGYEIPAGNLFSKNGSDGAPEIYCMGCRNPWRISVDPASGFVYWGDVGPDAAAAGPRGPQGFDEINQARGPGNFGWPLFIADNRPYADYDFATQTAGPLFDPLRPVNDSPLNTGARELPPARPAWIFYPYDGSPEFPALDGPGGRTACAGPVYHFEPGLASDTKFPAHYDGCLFVYEWSRHWIKAVRLAASGDIAAIEPFLPGTTFRRPVDMQFGPEGALYLLEYGTTWGTNPDSRLVRIDFHAGNRPPVARIAQQSAIGRPPVRVEFSHEGSFDPDGDHLAFTWRLRWPDGHEDELGEMSNDDILLISADGVYSIELEVTDPAGAKARAALPVLVGNSPPELAFDRPRHGGFVDPLEPITFHVALTDAEDDADDSPAAVRAQLSRAFVEARFVEGPPPSSSGEVEDPPGLARMKRSDCLNCHALAHRIVGPSLNEIAARARGVTGAIEAAMKRVREGSSGVWGATAMLPHPQHGDEELRAMVSWILSLEERGPPRFVAPGLSGEVPVPASSPISSPISSLESASPGGTWVFEASYTDGGGGPVGPLAARALLSVRTRRVEAEHFSSRQGTQTLESQSALGGKFIGAIDDGHFLRFAGVDLAGIARVTCRVSSAGAGATVEFRSDAPDDAGELLGSFQLEPNGAWEEWFEISAPIRDPLGLHDLLVVFRNEGQTALMNLDSLVFEPAPR